MKRADGGGKKVAIWLVLCGVSGMLGLQVFDTITKNSDMQGEIARARAQADALEKKNKDASDRLAQGAGFLYIEREAREKFGYQKPGEEVVIFKDIPSPPKVTTSDEGAGAGDGRSPAQKWIALFFGTR